MKLRKRIILSVITALFTLVFSYWVTNLNIPISGEKEVIATYEYLTNSEHPLNVPDSILLINVSYDRELVDVTEKEERRSGGTSIDTNKLSFDEGFFKGKYVLLFDDVITRGDSMRTFKRKMESLGAIVVGGLSLGKTKHERPVQGSIPQPFNRVFPPQPTNASDDDLPF